MRPTRPLLLSGATLLALLLPAGCCTAGHDRPQAALPTPARTVTFKTDPAGATIVVDGQCYAAPAEVALDDAEDHDVIVAATGYRTLHFKMKARWDEAGEPAAGEGAGAGFLIDTAGGAAGQFKAMAVLRLTPCDPDCHDTAPLELVARRGKLMTRSACELVAAPPGSENLRRPTAAAGVGEVYHD